MELQNLDTAQKKGLETLANRKDDTYWKRSTQAQNTEEQLKISSASLCFAGIKKHDLDW